MKNKACLFAPFIALASSILIAEPAVAQDQVVVSGPMQNWMWVNDTSWQRFTFLSSFRLVDVGYDNRSANPFTLSVYKNGLKYQDVVFGSNTTGIWAFSALTSPLNVQNGDIIDIVGSGTNQYVGVTANYLSQIDGITSSGFWFNSSNYYQFSGVGSLYSNAFANIRVQKELPVSVPEPQSVAGMIAFFFVGFICVRTKKAWQADS
jgi:hypothetical protein